MKYSGSFTLTYSNLCNITTGDEDGIAYSDVQNYDGYLLLLSSFSLKAMLHVSIPA